MGQWTKATVQLGALAQQKIEQIKLLFEFVFKVQQLYYFELDYTISEDCASIEVTFDAETGHKVVHELEYMCQVLELQESEMQLTNIRESIEDESNG